MKPKSFGREWGREEASPTSLPLAAGDSHVHADTGGRLYAASPRAATLEKEGDRLLAIQQVATILRVPVSWVYGRSGRGARI